MLNTLEMERYIAATAARADLKVVWEDTNHPRTNGKEIFLPRIQASVTPDEYKRMRKSVTHEVAHIRHSNCALVKETGLSAATSLLGAIWNGVEDCRVDYLEGKDYEGDRLCGNDVYGEQMDRIAQMAKDNPANPMVDSILPLVAYTNRSYSDFYPSAHRVSDTLEASLTPEGKKKFDKLMSGDYRTVLRNIRQIEDKKEGTQATLDLAKRIFEEVYDEDAEKEMERVKQEMEKQKGKGKDEGRGEQDGEGEGQGEGEGEGKAEGEDGKMGDGKDGKKREKEVRVDFSPMMMDPHDATGPSFQPMHINYDNHDDDSGSYIPATKDNYDVHNYAAGDTLHGGRYAAGYKPEISDALAGTSAGFAHQVRTILQVRDRDRYHYGLKRGRLHNSALYRVTMKDAPGLNERVFKRKQENSVLDAAITLVVDQSGSMGGKKYAHAAAAAVMLNDVIGNALHIPVEIVSFTSGYNDIGGTCEMFVHRQHKDKLLNKDNIMSRMSASAGHNMGGNADGDALMWAFDRLVQRPEKRKLMVVFSDGQPTDSVGTQGRSANVSWYLKQVVQSIERQSPVSIVGIGIMDQNVKRYYKEHKVINNAEELEPALLAVIEGKLK